MSDRTIAIIAIVVAIPFLILAALFYPTGGATSDAIVGKVGTGSMFARSLA